MMPRIFSTPALYLFILVVVALYWLTPIEHTRPQKWIQLVKDRQQATLSGDSPDTDVERTVDTTIHPVKALHKEALQRFERMIERQSKTLEEAEGEYRRRYRRNPPPGFDQWFEYAMARNSAIIDEFDMITESMEPFWKIKPHQIRHVYEKAASGDSLWTFSVHDGVSIVHEENWMGERIRDTLGDVVKSIPNFELLMNPLDEPRVLLSRDPKVEEVAWSDTGRKSSWEKVSEPCSHRDNSAQAHSSSELPNINTHGIPFVTNPWSSLDVCQNPRFKTTHGFLIAPFSFITTQSPVPILSQAALSTFSDILYPSMWYWDHIIDNLNEVDVDWDKKQNKMYWSGSSTGGLTTLPYQGSHVHAHRHRFIEMTKQLGNGVYNYLTRSESGVWTKYESEEVLAQLYDTKFTRMVQCDSDEICEEAGKYYHLATPEDGRIGFKSKFLMDLDGNSFSGRFYNFLASKSCPFKQTIFREWHDERLIPWAHYVPISVSLEEMPETMRYLSLTTEGNKIAKTIAETGRYWHDKLLRREDAAIYLYRLFLEYARVTSESRDERRVEVD